MAVSKNRKIEKYLESLKSPDKEIVEKIRRITLKLNKEIQEDIKWGNIIFNYMGNFAGFLVAKSHVTFVFFNGSMLKDPNRILKGSGPKIRTIRFEKPSEVNEKILSKLIKQAVELNKRD